MNEHITKDAPQETLFKPGDPWITNQKDIKLYTLEYLDNIKLSRSQYIATSIIKCGPYIDNILPMKTWHIPYADNSLM